MNGHDGIIKLYQGEDDRETFNNIYNARHDPREVAKWGKNQLAAAEHYMFARDVVGQNPWMLPSMMVATPAYQAAKMLGILPVDEYTSEPGLEQLKTGILGAWDGFRR